MTASSRSTGPPAPASRPSRARSPRALGFTYLDSRRDVPRGGAARACGAAPSPLRSRHPLRSSWATRVLLDGEDVTDAIRTPEVSEAASRVAGRPRGAAGDGRPAAAMLAHGDWVAEGRDIGTVVAPDADVKVFLTPTRRSARGAAPRSSAADPARCSPSRRSATSATGREHSPLQPAADAVELDTTGSIVEEVASGSSRSYAPPRAILDTPASLDPS